MHIYWPQQKLVPGLWCRVKHSRLDAIKVGVHTSLKYVCYKWMICTKTFPHQNKAHEIVNLAVKLHNSKRCTRLITNAFRWQRFKTKEKVNIYMYIYMFHLGEVSVHQKVSLGHYFSTVSIKFKIYKQNNFFHSFQFLTSVKVNFTQFYLFCTWVLCVKYICLPLTFNEKKSPF